MTAPDLAAMVDELEALLAKATAGPWADHSTGWITGGSDGLTDIAENVHHDGNRTLIVAAVNALPAILAALKMQAEALTLAEARFREYEATHQAKVRPHVQGVRWSSKIVSENEAARAKADRNREMADMCRAALHQTAAAKEGTSDAAL